ncbi:MAG: hypothetical protein JWR51_388 [Devosia sp.]|nr:hypothetical protein [Devosia sp.]
MVPKMIAALSIVAAGYMLSGCATPPQHASDGSLITFRELGVDVQVPGKPTTRCTYDEKRELYVCTDGTESELHIFVDPARIAFGGRVFTSKNR